MQLASALTHATRTHQGIKQADKQTNGDYTTHASIRPTQERLRPLILMAVVMSTCVKALVECFACCLFIDDRARTESWTRQRDDDEVVSDGG